MKNRQERSKIELRTQCACLDEKGNTWMVPMLGIPCLLCYQPVTSVAGLMMRCVKSVQLRGSSLFGDSAYTRAYCYDGKIIGVPCTEADIFIYDIEKEEVRYLPLHGVGNTVYYNCIFQKEKGRLILFPAVYSRVCYEVSLRDELVRTIPLDFGPMDVALKENQVQPLFSGEAVLDDCLYLAIGGTCEYLEVSLEDFSVHFKQLKVQQRLNTSFRSGDYIYFLSEGGTVLLREDMAQVLTLPYCVKKRMEYNQMDVAYFDATQIDSHVALLQPISGNPLLSVVDGEVEEVPSVMRGIENPPPMTPFYWARAVQQEGRIWLYPYYAKQGMCYEWRSQKADSFRFALPAGLLQAWYQSSEKGILVYEDRIPLSCFLELAALETEKCRGEAPQRIGQRIVDYILKEEHS